MKGLGNTTGTYSIHSTIPTLQVNIAANYNKLNIDTTMDCKEQLLTLKYSESCTFTCIYPIVVVTVGVPQPSNPFPPLDFVFRFS